MQWNFRQCHSERLTICCWCVLYKSNGFDNGFFELVEVVRFAVAIVLILGSRKHYCWQQLSCEPGDSFRPVVLAEFGREKLGRKKETGVTHAQDRTHTPEWQKARFDPTKIALSMNKPCNQQNFWKANFGAAIINIAYRCSFPIQEVCFYSATQSFHDNSDNFVALIVG